VDIAGAQGFLLGVQSVLDEPPTGPDDPPSGTVDPADPAGFHLEEQVVELQDDPAVPPAVGPLPGAGGQPGGQPPAGSESELKGLVDQMGAPVVEDRPGGRGTAAPAAGRGKSADTALDEHRPAQPAPGENLLHGRVVPIPAPVLEHRQHAARTI